jgi:nitroreductase
MEMNFFETVKKRRSIRKFKSDPVPESFIKKALEAAILAPNSSNTQTWDFYWVKSSDKKSRLVDYCLKQSAARTAPELMVVVANPKSWKRSQIHLINWVTQAKAPENVIMYYRKLIPLTYTWGIFNSLAIVKWFFSNLVGLFRPMLRGPFTKRDVQEVAIKSAALAAENFVLALTAQGLSSCMMEGFDEWRVKRLLSLPFSSRVVMVIGIGYEGERATWGPQFRLPFETVVHEI